MPSNGAHKLPGPKLCSWPFLAILVPAGAQSFEVSALVGGTWGGSFKLEQPVARNFHADLASSFTFGLSGGYLFNGEDCLSCSSIEFRWMRQDTHLQLPSNPLVATPPTAAFHPAVTMDDFLGDFTHEWPLREANPFRPFLTATLGAVRMDAPQSNSTRFAFGLGTGLKVFPSRHWGFQLKAEWLAIVLHGELQRVVCTTGCVVVLNGCITNQFMLSGGPVFRY